MNTDPLLRNQALNPAGSFLVQAPAGSGKTELLIQRYLSLLAIIEKKPEEILAITFTQKAAFEMKARIMEALNNIKAGKEPSTAHESLTQQLAKNALARCTTLGIDIIEMPQRLRIQTIDSFCTRINSSLSLESPLGGVTRIISDVQTLYEEAIEGLFRYLEKPHGVSTKLSEALGILLMHVNNDIERVSGLLQAMLSNRDGWLPLVLDIYDHTAIREKLEESLQAWIASVVSVIERSFTSQEKILMNNIMPQDPIFLSSPQRKLGSSGPLDSRLRGNDGTYALFIDSKGELRKRLPPKSSELLKAHKNEVMELYEKVAGDPILLQALQDLPYLPAPQYSEYQWEVLDALLEVLYWLITELYQNFALHGGVDFSYNARAALSILQSNESYQFYHDIRHILVDEFQDTSLSQYELLSALVKDWDPSVPHSLFLVGDPMQSIYSFRQAEVGLFLKVKAEGLAGFPLSFMALTQNFRSSALLINYFNVLFSEVFPKAHHIDKGAITYSPSESAASINPADTAMKVYTHESDAAETQIDTIVQIIAKHEKQSIAILVRSRKQVEELLPALSSAGIVYEAIDMLHFSEVPIIQDCLSMTRALYDVSDRLAWLALLRSPLCGLLLPDLTTVAEQEKISMMEALIAAIPFLSNDGQLRARYFHAHCEALLKAKPHYLSVAAFMEAALYRLQGEALMTTPYEKKIVERYFNVLRNYEEYTLPLFYEKLVQEYISFGSESFVKIMTIHQAKGLEFDVVILPFFEKSTRKKDKTLLEWGRLPSGEVLLSPMQGYHEKSNSISEAIYTLHKEKEAFEKDRLFYVAATRAKQYLYITTYLKEGKELPYAALQALACTPPLIRGEIGEANGGDLNVCNKNPPVDCVDSPLVKGANTLKRLPLSALNRPLLPGDF
jgi:ATP-dependent helicase/nuclease subunit A